MTTQGKAPVSSTPARRRQATKMVLVIALVLTSSLLMAMGALAQQSTRYDLACWSVTTGGGGERSSASFRLTDALGQNATATSTSANFEVRTGVVQNLAFLAPTPGPIVTPVPPPSGTVTINLPIISSYIMIQRTCPQ